MVTDIQYGGKTDDNIRSFGVVVKATTKKNNNDTKQATKTRLSWNNGDNENNNQEWKH